MKKKTYFIIGAVVVCIGLCFGIYNSNKKNSESFNVYYTSDLHSHFTKALDNFLGKRDKNSSLLLDAGDIVDIQTEDDRQWDTGEKNYGYIEDIGAEVLEKVAEPKEGTAPVIKKMIKNGYDAAVVGNHEFYGKMDLLNNVKSSFRESGIPFLSANTFYNKEYLKKDKDERFSEPYIVKTLKLPKGDVKVGIVGVTTTTINEEKPFEKGKEVNDPDVVLQNSPEYKGKMYMTDIIDESIKAVKELKQKENPDVVILVCHSGEKPKIPRHSGNYVQELAAKVPYVDLIIGGHTHEFIDKHEYTGPDNKKVVYTQPGSHSKGVGEAEIKLKKKNGKWSVSDIDSKNIKFKPDKDDDEDDYYYEYMEKNNIRPFRVFTKQQYEELKKKNPNVYITFVITNPKKNAMPFKGEGYEVYNFVDDPRYEGKFYYVKADSYDTAKKLIEKYSEN